MVVAFGVSAPAAGAATLSGFTLCFLGGGCTTTLIWSTSNTGIANQLDISHPRAFVGSDRYSLVANNEDTVIQSSAPSSCTHSSSGFGVSCAATDFDFIAVNLGDQADTVRINPCSSIRCILAAVSKPITENGNGGDDALLGGTGNDNLNGGNGSDTLAGEVGSDTLNAGTDSGSDTLIGGPDNDGTLDGGPGFDTVSYDDGRAAGVTVTMNGGAADGDSEDVVNAEKVIGTGAADVLTGSSGGDVIEGRGGNDTITGGAGGDILSGEAGNDSVDGGTDGDNISGGTESDTVTYATRSAAVHVALGGTSGNGEGAEGDFINADVENVIGGGGSDTLSVSGTAIPVGSTLDGRAGADTITGGTFGDTLIGGAGADPLNGGGGTDLASYSDHSGGVNASLVTHLAAGDTLANIENLTGGPGADTLTGDGAVNRLDGAGGDDTIQGGGGTDVLRAGAGVDTVDYSERASGQPVTVSLDNTINDGVTGENDDIGTEFERINGGAGADTLSAAAVTGVATLRGNSGNDTLFAPNGGGALLGDAGNDTLTGGDAADTMDGGLGDDTIDGQGGTDTVQGGDGSDSIEARDGVADSIDCGADEDTALTEAVDTRANCENPADPAPQTQSQPQPAAQTGPQPVIIPRLFATITFSFSSFPAFTKLTVFKVTNVPSGATVQVSCKAPKGKKCPAKRFKKKGAGTIAIKPFTKRNLPAGTKLTVTITKPGTIGLVKLITIRKRKTPSSTTLCLPPGAKAPSKCTS